MFNSLTQVFKVVALMRTRRYNHNEALFANCTWENNYAWYLVDRKMSMTQKRYHRRKKWGGMGAFAPPPEKKNLEKIFFGQMQCKILAFC